MSTTCAMFSFSPTALQLGHTMIFFAPIPNKCVTGATAGKKDTFVSERVSARKPVEAVCDGGC